MTQYAPLDLAVLMPVVPGASRMFRLPAMMPGEFHITATGYSLPASAAAGPGASLRPTGAPTALGKVAFARPAVETGNALRPNIGVGPLGPGDVGGPLGPIGPGAPMGPAPYLLTLDLYHGDELVASGAPPPLQQSTAMGDDSWRVMVHYPPESESTDNVRFDLMPYTSMLPVLNRHIPLAFLQQGVNSNWNGRNYISLVFENSTLSLRFDPEIASYYHLAEQDIPVATHITEVPPNMEVQDIRIRVDSSSGDEEGFPESLPWPLPSIQLTVTVGGVDGQPITGSIGGGDFSVSNFSINVKFFVTPTISGVPDNSLGTTVVGYRCLVETDLLDEITATNIRGDFLSAIAGHWAASNLHNALAELEDYLDSHAGAVGGALTPWLLGAAFEVVGVGYDPVSSQPTPTNLPGGDMVVTYIGLAEPGSSAPTAELPPSALTITSNAVDGVVGARYELDLSAVGGVSPYVWGVAGTLPPGVALSDASLAGSPTTQGLYSFQVTVVDSSGTVVKKAYVVAINGPGFAIATPAVLPGGVVGDAYAEELSATGGTGLLTWSATGLAPGLDMTAAGVLSGTPTGNGSVATLIVQAVDAQGAAARRAFTLQILDESLFGEQIYTPRGAGDAIWAPPKPADITPTQVPIEPVRVTPGNLSKIDNIVVLMMENRSFDHMLGYLSREGGRSDIEGLRWENDANRTQFNFYNGFYYYPNRLIATHLFNPESLGPDHSFESVKAQMADNMGHFVSDYARNKITDDDPAQLSQVMGYYTGEQLTTYDMLAREFAVCDHWFCSHPGPTWPNRFVALTGDLNRDSYGEPEVNTPLYSDFTPSEATTIFDLLTDRKVGWQYFEQRASTMRAYTKYTFDMVNVLQYSDPVNGFAASVKQGLEAVTFVDPLFGDLPAGIGSPQDNDDAPPSDLADGQRFVLEVATTLFTPASNPSWERTMLIIVYDEHGGFYDHVQPPTDAVPLTGQNNGKLGPRVPAFVVSPWTPAGMVLTEVFDHTSIAATILRRFCNPYPPFLSDRVSAARDLRDALPLTMPRGTIEPLFGLPLEEAPPTPLRTEARTFQTPAAADAFGSLLGAIALMLGKGRS